MLDGRRWPRVAGKPARVASLSNTPAGRAWVYGSSPARRRSESRRGVTGDTVDAQKFPTRQLNKALRAQATEGHHY